MCGSTYLIPRANWEFLLGPVTTRAAVDKVYANFFHLFNEDCALLDPPLLPFISDFLWTLSPVSRADANE